MSIHIVRCCSAANPPHYVQSSVRGDPISGIIETDTAPHKYSSSSTHRVRVCMPVCTFGIIISAQNSLHSPHISSFFFNFRCFRSPNSPRFPRRKKKKSLPAAYEREFCETITKSDFVFQSGKSKRFRISFTFTRDDAKIYIDPMSSWL